MQPEDPRRHPRDLQTFSFASPCAFPVLRTAATLSESLPEDMAQRWRTKAAKAKRLIWCLSLARLDLRVSGDEATPSRFRCAVMEERHADTNEGQGKPSIPSPLAG
jgi:hypothetical protein